MRVKTLLILILILLFNPNPSHSFLLNKEDIGTKAASFLKLNPSPKILSLGGYSSSLITGIESINSNPAGLVLLSVFSNQPEAMDYEPETNHIAFSSSYHLYLKDISYAYLSAYKRVNPSFALALSMANIDIGKMKITTKDDIYGIKDNHKFHPNFQIVNISYGRYLISEELSLGLNTKILRSHIKKNKEQSISLDIGTIYTPTDPLNLSFLIKDLGIKLNKESLPTEIILGLGLKLLQNTLLLNLDLILPSDDRVTLTTGIEYNFQDILYTRMGYKSNVDKELKYSSFSLGMELKIENISLDYAFLPYGELGDSHRMAISWGR